MTNFEICKERIETLNKIYKKAGAGIHVTIDSIGNATTPKQLERRIKLYDLTIKQAIKIYNLTEEKI